MVPCVLTTVDLRLLGTAAPPAGAGAGAGGDMTQPASTHSTHSADIATRVHRHPYLPTPRSGGQEASRSGGQ